jgi:hypothetical protein
LILRYKFETELSYLIHRRSLQRKIWRLFLVSRLKKKNVEAHKYDELTWKHFLISSVVVQRKIPQHIVEIATGHWLFPLCVEGSSAERQRMIFYTCQTRLYWRSCDSRYRTVLLCRSPSINYNVFLKIRLTSMLGIHNVLGRSKAQ